MDIFFKVQVSQESMFLLQTGHLSVMMYLDGLLEHLSLDSSISEILDVPNRALKFSQPASSIQGLGL